MAEITAALVKQLRESPPPLSVPLACTWSERVSVSGLYWSAITRLPGTERNCHRHSDHGNGGEARVLHEHAHAELELARRDAELAEPAGTGQHGRPPD